jgi:hypothetical protein
LVDLGLSLARIQAQLLQLQLSKVKEAKDYVRTMDYATTLYRASLRLRQYEKAFRDTGCDTVLFETKEGSQIIDSTDLKIASGIQKGAYNEIFTSVEKQGDVWVESCNIHDHEMARMILNNVDSFRDGDLFKI